MLLTNLAYVRLGTSPRGWLKKNPPVILSPCSVLGWLRGGFPEKSPCKDVLLLLQVQGRVASVATEEMSLVVTTEDIPSVATEDLSSIAAEDIPLLQQKASLQLQQQTSLLSQRRRLTCCCTRRHLVRCNRRHLFCCNGSHLFCCNRRHLFCCNGRYLFCCSNRHVLLGRTALHANPEIVQLLRVGGFVNSVLPRTLQSPKQGWGLKPSTLTSYIFGTSISLC